MFDLMVAATPVPEPPIDLILIQGPGALRPPSPGCVRIAHLSHTGRNDVIERPEEDAVRLFWRFVREKFGVVPVPPG